MPADIVDNVAAVVLFGTPAGWSAEKYGASAIDVGPAYAAKALEFCAPGDTVCTGAAPSGSSVAHQQYGVNGMVDQAAAFTVSRLVRPPAPV